MRWGFFLAAVLVLIAPRARAQVSVNLNALGALAPAQTAKPGPSRAAGSTSPARAGTVLPAPAMSGKLPLPPVPPSPPPATVATLGQTAIGPLPSPPPRHPPPNPVIAPIVLVGPPHPEPMPPPPHVVDGASGTATRIPDGLRVTFSADGAALNPATLAALRETAASAAGEHAPSVSVDAYAKSDPSDPSTARRLSLSRALAAQAVLREAGIPSEHISVRALLATFRPVPKASAESASPGTPMVSP
jgi:outer membrane protein OmpA-like peptidoglycan-associated protein